MKKQLFISILLLVSFNVFSQKTDKGFLYAQTLFNTHRYDEALIEFKKVISYDENEEVIKNIYITKIYILLEESVDVNLDMDNLDSNEDGTLLEESKSTIKNLDDAILYLEYLKITNPKYPDIYYILGEAYFKKKEYSLAQQNYLETKKLGIFNYELNKKLGISSYHVGDFIIAIGHLEEAKRIKSSDVILSNYLGMCYFNVARKDLAISTLRSAFNKSNDNFSSEIAVNLSLVFDDLEENDSSIFYLKKAIERNPDRVDALYFLGNKFYDLKKYHQSQFYYEKLLNINPDFEKAYTPLANAYFLDNLFDKAIEKYNQSTFFNDKASAELNYIGISYLQMGNITKAKSYFEESVKVDPTFVQGYINLAFISFKEKKYDESISYLSFANQYKKEDADIYFLFAKVYVQMERLEDAEYYFKETIRFNPLKRRAYLYLGHITLLKNKLTEANFFYDMLLTFDPNHIDANLYRGISSYLSKDYEESLKYLQTSENMNPGDYKTRYQVSKTLIKLKDYMPAFIKLDQLKRENPNDRRLDYLLYKTSKSLGLKDDMKKYKSLIDSYDNN